MRTPFRISFIALLLTGMTCPAPAQEARKIVERYVKAAGGSKALSKIRTLTLEGAFTSGEGKAGTYTLDTKLPNRYYMELLVNEKSWIEAYNGKSAWHQTAGGEPGTLVGPEGMQLEAAAQYYNSHLINPKKSKIVVTFVGHAQVRGKDSLQLELTAATVGGVEEEILYDDYCAVAIRGRNRIRRRRPGEEARGQRVHLFLPQRS